MLRIIVSGKVRFYMRILGSRNPQNGENGDCGVRKRQSTGVFCFYKKEKDREMRKMEKRSIVRGFMLQYG